MTEFPLSRARPSRRAILRRAAGLAAAAMLAPSAARQALGQAARFTGYPFTLGVASGNPTPDGVVLWTRLAPEPFAPNAGMVDTYRVQLRWEVARDERFADIVQRGTILTVPELAHSAHVEVSGLEPARWYFYRFMVAQETSPIGRTRTAPAAGAAVDRLRFAFASCQQFEQGYYAAYRHMAAENLDLVAFLGDYIYESSWGARTVRRHHGGEPVTLAQYRVRHAQYKGDPDLQRMHALAPWILTWDDHEVDNDYAGAVSEHLDPNFLARAAAYQAYFEHMPLRMSQVPRGPDLKLYDRFAFGNLATFHVLDDRQYRTQQPCPLPGIAGARAVENCAARMDPAQTMLGAEQERWLEAGFAAGGAPWNVIAQQTLMASINVKEGNTCEAYWTDGWSGYPLARRRLLGSLVQHRVSNPIVIGGDVHANWVCDLKPDVADERAPIVATEVCGTSITSQGLPQASLNAVKARNSHVRFANSEKRGYVTVEFTPARAQVALRTLDDASKRDANIATLASFVVEDGRPGVQAA